MTTDRAVMQQWFDALAMHHTDPGYWDARCAARLTMRQALAQPVAAVMESDSPVLVSAGEMQRMTARIAELEQGQDALDAKRYQWLRARLPGSAYRIAGVIYSEGGSGVDIAIDAAMGTQPAPAGEPKP